MTRSIATHLITALGLVACGGAPASETEKPGKEEPATPAVSRAPSPGPSHAMLRDYVNLLTHVAKGNSGAELVPALDELTARASAAETFGTVSGEFAKRFTRLVRVTKLTLTADRATAHRELSAFVSDIEGAPRQIDPDGGLAEVAPALAEEVIRLHLLAAGNEDRAAAEAAYAFEPR